MGAGRLCRSALCRSLAPCPLVTAPHRPRTRRAGWSGGPREWGWAGPRCRSTPAQSARPAAQRSACVHACCSVGGMRRAGQAVSHSNPASSSLSSSHSRIGSQLYERRRGGTNGGRSPACARAPAPPPRWARRARCARPAARRCAGCRWPPGTLAAPGSSRACRLHKNFLASAASRRSLCRASVPLERG